MGRKDKKIILLAQCLVNPYCRVHLLGQNFPFTHQLMDYLLSKRVGIIQYQCPETTAMGLQRNPQGRQQYDNVFFRNHCKELLKIPMLMVKEFLRNNYRLVCYIGLENSPTCGIHWGKHKVNKYQKESMVQAEEQAPDDPVLKGIMAEILSDELLAAGIETPFLEFPGKEAEGSEKQIRFWEDLRKCVEPYADYGYRNGEKEDEDDFAEEVKST